VLNKGLNTIKISTDSECQGEVLEEIFISEKVVVYSNPTKGDLKVFVGGEESQVKVTLVDSNGQKFISTVKDVGISRIINLDITSFRNGVYILLLDSETVRESIKVIKI